MKAISNTNNYKKINKDQNKKAESRNNNDKTNDLNKLQTLYTKLETGVINDLTFKSKLKNV